MEPVRPRLNPNAITFSDEQLADLKRLAIKHRVSVATLIHRVVAGWLELQHRPRRGQARLPFPGEVLRAQRRVLEALADLEEAKKLHPDPPPMKTAKRTM